MNALDVRRIFDYRDGRLYWRVSPINRIPAGKEAGHFSKNEHLHVVGLNHTKFTRPQLVWAWHRGEWPNGNLRHLDGNSQNDRIENLIPQSELFDHLVSELPETVGGSEMFKAEGRSQAPAPSNFCENGKFSRISQLKDSNRGAL